MKSINRLNMNSDYSSILDRIDRARRAAVPRALPIEEQRRLLLQQALVADSPITEAALLAVQQRQLLGSPGLTRRSIAESQTGGYLPGLSLKRAPPTDLRPTRSELRLALSMLTAGRRGPSSIPISHTSCIMSPSADGSLTPLVPNMALAQFPAPDRLQLTSESHRVKRARSEDLLDRTRGNMMLKPVKKAKHRPEYKNEVVGRTSAVLCANQTFPLPPTTEQQQRTVKASLVSYGVLWSRIGGYNGKERFQRMVQNGRVPLARPSQIRKHG